METTYVRQNCIFLYNAMKTTYVRQGMIIMRSDVMDTIFHSADAWDYNAIKLSSEVSLVLPSE